MSVYVAFTTSKGFTSFKPNFKFLVTLNEAIALYLCSCIILVELLT